MTDNADPKRPIKVVIAIVGLDQHEVGSMIVSRILSEAGMEVVYLGRFNTPAGVTAAAVDENADVVGISCHSWEYLEFAGDVVDALREHDIPVVFGGSVITPGDAASLQARGVARVFGSSSTHEEIVRGIEECASAAPTPSAAAAPAAPLRRHATGPTPTVG